MVCHPLMPRNMTRFWRLILTGFVICKLSRRRPHSAVFLCQTPIFFLSYLRFLVTLSSSAVNWHHHLAPPPSASPRMVPRSAPGDASASRGGVHAQHRGGRPKAVWATSWMGADTEPPCCSSRWRTLPRCSCSPRAAARGRAWRRGGGCAAAGGAQGGVPQCNTSGVCHCLNMQLM